MHSKYSDDGEFTPTQLVEQCHVKAGIMLLWQLLIIIVLKRLMKRKKEKEQFKY